MDVDFTDLETLWSSLLSGQIELIHAAFESLTDKERRAVYAHLERMVREPGWQPEQRASAEAALKALKPQISH